MSSQISWLGIGIKIAVLEDAYIASRYYPRRYREEDVRDKLEIFKELLELVESHEE